MAIKSNKNNYIIKNKYSRVIMSIEPKSELNYLNLEFILTRTKRLRLGYGLNVLNQAIEYAKQLGYGGVMIDKNQNINDLIENILNDFLIANHIRQESGHYVFDSIIVK